jgi:hypothetical protein
MADCCYFHRNCSLVSSENQTNRIKQNTLVKNLIFCVYLQPEGTEKHGHKNNKEK